MKKYRHEPWRYFCFWRGWFNGTAKYDFAAPVTGDLTLTAQWTIIPFDLVAGPRPTLPFIPAFPIYITAPEKPTDSATRGDIARAIRVILEDLAK